eukprot:766718-Hanusia_phi.AAC.11
MENSMNVLQQINELSSTLDVQLNMEKRSQNADHRLIEIETQEKDGMDHAVVNQVKRLRSAMDVIRSGRCLEVTSSISIRETSIVSFFQPCPCPVCLVLIFLSFICLVLLAVSIAHNLARTSY